MKSPIAARFQAFRGRIRRALGLYGASWVLVTLLGIATVCGLLDWLLDLTSGVRALLLAALIAATAWTAYRTLVVPFLFPLADIDLALRVESRFPRLNDELASAVDFLHHADASPQLGSAALRSAVVEQASRRMLALDFGEAVEWATMRRAVLSASAVLLAAAALVLASPRAAATAAVRLFQPFGATRWPRETFLAIADTPTRLARGEPFRLAVRVVEGRVPERAEVDYAFEDGARTSEPLRPRGDREFLGGLEAVTQSFDYRVRAGDGRTEPAHVEVVPPPELEALRVRLTYPDYTRQAAEDLATGKGQVRAVWGTRVDVSARSSKPLARAELRIGVSGAVPARVEPGNSELEASFRLEESGFYWISLRDQEGFENREASRYELRVIEDHAPEVFVERPASDIEVTAAANVPLRALVKDDFGIQNAELHYSHAGSEDETAQTVTLWTSAEQPQRQVIEHVWQLGELALTPGASVSYYLSARDSDNLRGPNTGKSRQLRLLVVSPEDLARRLEEKQLRVYQELERLRKLQADARTQVSDLHAALQQQEALSKEQLAHLQSVEVTQRQIDRHVTNPADGLRAQVGQIESDLANNHLDNSQLGEQLAMVREGLEHIAREDLPEIDQGITRVRKAAQESLGARGARAPRGDPQGRSQRAAGEPPVGTARPAPPDTATAPRPPETAPDRPSPAPEQATPTPDKPASNLQRAGLADIETHQQRVVARLDEMLERMGKWETYRGIARDARELLEEQDQLAQQTREAGRKTIGQTPENLPTALQAELGKLAGHQEQKREQLARLERKLDQMSGRLAEGDAAAADALRAAAEGLRRSGTEEQMRRAASNIRQNQVGAADTAQRKAIEALKQMLESLENTPERDLAKLIAKLREAETELGAIRERQAAQLERTQQASANPDPEARRRELEKLAREEKELEQQTARLAEQLRRIRAEQAGRTSAGAASRMGQAGGQMQQSEGDKAAGEEQKVLEELQRAQREVAQARREAEAQLAMEQLARIGDTLASLLERETAAKTETARLEELRRQKGDWSRPQLASLRTLVQTQQAIRDDTEKARDLLTSAPVFALVLRRATGTMDRVLDRLGERHTDDETQTAEQAAADRFAQLLDALKKDPNAESQQGGQEAEGGQEGQGGQGQRDSIPPVAQLKMLRALQIEVNERTAALDELRATAQKLSPSQTDELRSLGEDQGALADLVRDLARPTEEGDEP